MKKITLILILSSYSISTLGAAKSVTSPFFIAGAGAGTRVIGSMPRFLLPAAAAAQPLGTHAPTSDRTMNTALSHEIKELSAGLPVHDVFQEIVSNNNLLYYTLKQLASYLQNGMSEKSFDCSNKCYAEDYGTMSMTDYTYKFVYPGQLYPGRIVLALKQLQYNEDSMTKILEAGYSFYTTTIPDIKALNANASSLSTQRLTDETYMAQYMAGYTLYRQLLNKSVAEWRLTAKPLFDLYRTLYLKAPVDIRNSFKDHGIPDPDLVQYPS